MPSPPNTESPAALVNFVFRQLPDDVVDELKDSIHGGPLEAVISVVGGSRTLPRTHPSHCRTASARAAIR